jgi:transposase
VVADRAAAAEGAAALPLSGRKRLPDRQALQGILFVLYTGIAWRHLPPELGFGGGSTCHRRMDEWQRAGVWDRLHEVLRAELRAAGEIEWSRAVADSSHVQAKQGASVTGGNGNDVTQLVPLIERIPPCAVLSARPAFVPTSSSPTAATTTTKHRRLLRERGIRPVIARRQTEHGSGLGRIRWVVERTFAWLHNHKTTTRPLRPPPRDPRKPSSPSPAASSASEGCHRHSESTSYCVCHNEDKTPALAGAS